MNRSARPRWDLDWYWWGLAFALALGICGYWPYLQREHARLETWPRRWRVGPV